MLMIPHALDEVELAAVVWSALIISRNPMPVDRLPRDQGSMWRKRALDEMPVFDLGELLTMMIFVVALHRGITGLHEV
jgi:hypothetical protein